MSSSIEQPVQGGGINLLSWVGSKQAPAPATGSPAATPAVPAVQTAPAVPAASAVAPADTSKMNAIELFDLSTKELTDANTQIDVMIKEEKTATTDKTIQSIDSINNSIMSGIAYLKAGIDKRNFT